MDTVRQPPAGGGGEGTLALRLARGPLGTEAALRLGLDLARALGELHARGRAHLALDPTAVHWHAGDRVARLAAPGAAVQQPAYTAPEQTGRLDAQPDARSDLYALGIVLHEALAGTPPMRSDDALAQIHWHIAGVPRPLTESVPSIPPVLSDIVLKLIAKSPDDRYQSAAALAQDLGHGLRDWAARGAIAPFPLARRDRGERLRVPARLYGREREVGQLLAAFERVCAGERVAVMVQGWSGIGKTALIQQLVRPIVRQKGHFLAGKFDQVARGVPFGALIEALRGLVRQLLGYPEAQLAPWREAMRAGLGDNGGVLTEVVPELAHIVGPQPAPVPLAGLEAQNRFQRVLQNVVAALATREHPMVLFLDDLQWADAATLSLLEPLLARGEIGSLMLIGAFRDNELDASPRLAHTLASLEAAGAAPQRLVLGPLADEALVALVADTLHDSAANAAPLARLVLEKTGGNPFFVIQFLQMLARDGHLRFDDDTGRWRCVAARLADVPLADNVVELMTLSIRRLGERPQATLTLAACIGNRFDAATLALVAGRTPEEVELDLDAARAQGLIVAARGGAAPVHAFLHDRVQQAAYALIPPGRREAVHLAVGRLLRGREGSEGDAALFDTVHHLNRGARLIEAPAERRDVAALNLAAGRRAKASAAHESARELFRHGRALLDDAAWRDAHALAVALALELADSEMLCGDLDAAQAVLAELLPRAEGAVEQARAMHRRSLVLEAGGRYADAVASTREGLVPLGVNLPEGAPAQEAALEREIDTIEALRGGRAIASLVELPPMRDASVRLVMAMLTDIWAACYIVGEATLARLISATLVRLSLVHGNVEESAYGYVTHAITVGPLRGRYREAHAYGRLALAVNARLDDRRLRAKVYQQFHAHVNLWCEPYAACRPYAREACRAGLDGGDFLYAAYAAGTEAWAAMACADDLARVVAELEPSVALIERLKNPPFADSLRVILGGARALQGLTAAPLSLSDARFDEAAWVERNRGNGFFGCIHAVVRLQLCTLLGDAAQALAAAQASAALVAHLPGTIWPVLHDFWHGLALARACDAAPAAQREAWLVQIRRAQQALAALAAHCAQNVHGQALVLEAEIARLEGRPSDALRACEQAIEFAAAPGLLALHALAHERCAALHGQLAQPRLAALHLAAARAAYARWGAAAKVAALDRAAPAADAPAPRPAEPPAPRDEADGLDHFSVLKAAQAIAAETGVGALLARLMQIALENAGADRGALVLDTDAGAVVHAFAADAPAPPDEGEPLDGAHGVPEALVRYVLRTGDAVVLADASRDETHANDPWVLRERPRALMVLPVQRQGRTLGVLVLANRHVGGVFSAARRATMAALATQALISLENARLLARLEAENTSLRRDLVANVSHDLRTPLVSMRGYLELLAAKGDALDPATRDEYLAIAVRQCERLGTLVDELFELAKLDFKGLALQRERFAFAELALDVAQRFRLEAGSRGVALAVQAEPALPFVEADLGLMERVLENLIVNALRHTPAGGRIELGVAREGDAVAVRVEDSGCGIAPADLPRLFDRFWRGGGGGTGLGLAITRRILELHGSTIAAHSDGATGSRFVFRLAACPPPAAPASGLR